MSKKEQILESSIEVFVEFGFHGAPIKKLIKSAGVSNGTFFYYFKTKEDLITELYVQTKSDLYRIINNELDTTQSTKRNIETIWYQWVKWGIKNEMKFRFLELFANSPYINVIEKKEMQEAFEFIKTIINKGMDDEILIEMNYDQLSGIIYGNIRASILFAYINEGLSESEMDKAFAVMWKGIVNT